MRAYCHARPSQLTKHLGVLFVFMLGQPCRSDVGALVPTPNNMAETNSSIPFYAAGVYPSPVTVRYQQVCNASLFTNIPPNCVYVSLLSFRMDNRGSGGWTVSNLQVNLSTTQKLADGFDSNFSANVGPDDTTVFGPSSFVFGGGSLALQDFPLDRPFRYNPRLGSLLVDVRIAGIGPPQGSNPDPSHDAYNSPSDEVSRIWAPDVTATAATDGDTTGLFMVVRFSPVPSLTATFYPVWYDVVNLTNIVKIAWPSLPPGFLLQKSDRLGAGALWQSVTNQVEGADISQFGARWIKFPAKSAGSSGYFRLVMPSGP